MARLQEHRMDWDHMYLNLHHSYKMVSNLGFDSVIQDQTAGIHDTRFTLLMLCLDFVRFPFPSKGLVSVE